LRGTDCLGVPPHLRNDAKHLLVVRHRFTQSTWRLMLPSASPADPWCFMYAQAARCYQRRGPASPHGWTPGQNVPQSAANRLICSDDTSSQLSHLEWSLLDRKLEKKPWVLTRWLEWCVCKRCICMLWSVKFAKL